MKLFESGKTTAVLVALMATSVLAGCTSGEEGGESVTETTTAATPVETNRRVIRVETQTIERSEFEDRIVLTGSVKALNDAVLSAQTAGSVNRLVSLGTAIRRGQSVANLDATIANATLTQAKAELEVATANKKLAEETFSRQEKLYADSIISFIEFEQIQTQLAQARAQVARAEGLVAQAEKQIQFTRVPAPFSGTVEQHFVDTGEQVAPGSPIARIVETSRVKLSVGVPERYSGNIRVGTPAEIEFSTYGMGTMDERVSFVGKVIDSASRTFPVEIQIRNRDGKLKPEMVASARILVDAVRDAIVVPQNSIIRDEVGESVFVVEGSGSNLTARRRTIEAGPSYDGKTVVIAGLEVGDRLITAGQNNVSTGDYVEPVNSPNMMSAAGASR